MLTFKGPALVKANIVICFWCFAFEWYILNFHDFNRNALKNNLDVKNWINILSHHFKISSSIAFDFLIIKTYFLNDARAQWPFASYVYAIMW